MHDFVRAHGVQRNELKGFLIARRASEEACTPDGNRDRSTIRVSRAVTAQTPRRFSPATRPTAEASPFLAEHAPQNPGLDGLERCDRDYENIGACSRRSPRVKSLLSTCRLRPISSSGSGRRPDATRPCWRAIRLGAKTGRLAISREPLHPSAGTSGWIELHILPQRANSIAVDRENEVKGHTVAGNVDKHQRGMPSGFSEPSRRPRGRALSTEGFG